MLPVIVARRYLAPVFAASIFAIALLVPACGGLRSDCSNYCERYHECIDSTVVIGTCEDRCHVWAVNNDERESKVDKCSECVSQNDTCSDATRRCLVDCAGIPVR